MLAGVAVDDLGWAMTKNNQAEIPLSQWIGITGVAVAATISWSANTSIAWAALHGACSWFYVIYYAIRYS